MDSKPIMLFPTESSEFAPAILAFCIIIFGILFVLVLARFLWKYRK